MPTLTSNDYAVLQALFDAESSPSSAIKVDSTLPAFPKHLHITSEDHESFGNREASIITYLQADTTQKNVHSAIQALDALIDDHPTYPPAYANRAQALRMLIGDGDSSEQTPEPDVSDAMFTDRANTTTVSRLFADLGQAIDLSTPLAPADPVSPAQARLLADTHTHRGYLLLKAARARNTRGRSGPVVEIAANKDNEVRGVGQLWNMGVDQLEEMASRDFFLGGRYGNLVARQLAVQTNPYAKMCGAIVKEAMRKEVEA